MSKKKKIPQDAGALEALALAAPEQPGERTMGLDTTLDTTHRTYAAVVGGVIVSVRCLDGGDVEITVNGEPITLDNGVILRWGRKR